MTEASALGATAQPLLEREAALDAIAGALADARAGKGSALFVTGPAGIGKTAVVDAGAAVAANDGFTVAHAVGSPMESGLPFGLVEQAITRLGGGAFEDAAELARLGGQPARLFRTFRWLARLADERPLLLALDDLHWADPDSLELLGFISRRLAGAPLAVVGALRPEPDAASALARELGGSARAEVIRLAPLSREASAVLVSRSASREVTDRDAERLWRACAGTPLLLKAGAWALSGGGSLPAPAADGTFAAALLLERFAGAGGDAFRYVQAASILGVRFRSELAAGLAGLDGDIAAEAHRSFVRAGLLEDLGGGMAAFVHPLFAQALFESQAPSERERGHARAFQLLVEAGSSDALAAEHAIAARLIGDPLALEVAARAGRAALAEGALAAAVGHLGHAVELAGDDVPAQVLVDYAAALSATARVQEARDVCNQLLVRDDLEPDTRARVLTMMARGAMAAGRPDEAEGLYEDAAEAAAAARPAVEAATLAEAALGGQAALPSSWVLDKVLRALAVLPKGDPRRKQLELLRSYAALMGADPAGTDLLQAEIRRRIERGGEDEGWAWTFAVHSLNACKLLEQLGGANELFEREFASALEDGAPILINALAIAYADAVHRLGRPQEALELVQRAIDIWPLAPWSHLAPAVMLTELGRDEEAEPHLQALRAFRGAVPERYYAQVSLWLDVITARQRLARGEAHAASETMLHAERVAALTGWRHPLIVPWGGVAIEAHFAAGRLDEVRALVEQLEAFTASLGCRGPLAAAALGRAHLAAEAGRIEEADAYFRQAISIFSGLPRPIAAAETLISYGTHMRRTGRPRQSREPLARALELAERAGAGRVVELASAELAASGGRRRRREQDPGRLTPQEQRVAELAAEGLTNTQIAAALHLSPKTVGHHLGRVYAKLGLSSRRELIRKK